MGEQREKERLPISAESTRLSGPARRERWIFFFSVPFPVFRLQTRDRLGTAESIVCRGSAANGGIMGNLAGKKGKVGVVSNPITRGK